MSNPLPLPVVAVVSNALAAHWSHATLTRRFEEAGVLGEPTKGNKEDRCRAYLRRAGSDTSVNAHVILGKILFEFMEMTEITVYAGSWEDAKAELDARRARIHAVLAEQGLRYEKGGSIVGGGGVPARTLSQLLAGRDLRAIQKLFEEALAVADTKPEDAAGKACSMLETVLRHIIEATDPSAIPNKLDCPGLWKVVRGLLNLDPAEQLGKQGEDDLRAILSGLAAVVGGLGSLRTHESAAHGTGPKGYRLKARHARVAVHSASTLAIFLIETWEEQNQAPLSV